jgi:hypothetical protein
MAAACTLAIVAPDAHNLHYDGRTTADVQDEIIAPRR